MRDREELNEQGVRELMGRAKEQNYLVVAELCRQWLEMRAENGVLRAALEQKQLVTRRESAATAA